MEESRPSCTILIGKRHTRIDAVGRRLREETSRPGADDNGAAGSRTAGNSHCPGGGRGRGHRRGALFALVSSLDTLRNASETEAYYHFRRRLGRAILLGLELLVAADIVGTVAVEPTLENVLVLALIVLIRTFLSVSLTLEIEGRWPWQGGGKQG